MVAENPFAQVDLSDAATSAHVADAENGGAGVATNGMQGALDPGKAEAGAAFEPLEIELEESTGDGACATAWRARDELLACGEMNFVNLQLRVT